MQAVILAAGRGKRLKPLTSRISKAMVPILNKPIIGRILDTIIPTGINNYIVVIRPGDNTLVNFLSDYYKELSIDFVIQETPLGMAKALELASPYITGNFIMSVCDSIFLEEHVRNLIDAYKKGRSKGALSLMEVEESFIPKTGIVSFDQHDLVDFIVEKPSIEEAPSNIAALPLYLFSMDLLKFLPKVRMSKRGEYELQDAIQMLIENTGGLTWAKTDFRHNLTAVNDLLEISMSYLQEVGFRSTIKSKLGEESTVSNPVFVEENVHIGKRVSIGPNVFVQSGCQISDGTRISNSVVIQGSSTAPDQIVNDAVIF